MHFAVERLDAATHMDYLRRVAAEAEEGVHPRSILRHIRHGLESWDERLRRDGAGRDPVHAREGEDWAISMFSRTAHDTIVEALGSYDPDEYGPDTHAAVVFADRLVRDVIEAWYTLDRDIRAAGAGVTFAEWEALAEQAVDVMTGVRNAAFATLA